MISISTDSQFVHKIWDEEELSKMVEGGIPFHMASDGGGALGKVYGVYDENAGVDIRGRFLLDPDGIVQAMEVMTPPVGVATWMKPSGRLKPSSMCVLLKALKPALQDGCRGRIL